MSKKICFGFLLIDKFYGQATKGVRWMPWHFEATKDVESCDKQRLEALILWTVDFRMGKPNNYYLNT